MKYALLAALIAFVLYWSVKGIARRLRGEMPGRKPPKQKRSSQHQRPGGSQPKVPTPPPPVRDARFRDVK